MPAISTIIHKFMRIDSNFRQKFVHKRQNFTGKTKNKAYAFCMPCFMHYVNIVFRVKFHGMGVGWLSSRLL